MPIHIILYVVAFYEVILMLLIPSSANLTFAGDGSTSMYAVMLASLAIGFHGLVYGDGPINKSFFPIVLFMVISSAHGPNIHFDSTFTPKDAGIWNYKPMFEVMVFLIFFIGTCRAMLNVEHLKKIFGAIVWIGVFYSVYAVLQRFGMDQFYKVMADPNNLSRNPGIGGFIGQPVFAAALLSVCLPFALYEKKVWKVALIGLAILLTGNRAAMIAAVVAGLIFYPKARRIGHFVMAATFLGALLTLLLAVFYPQYTSWITDSGRLLTWKQLLSDFVHSKFSGIDVTYILTGQGIGSFSVLFPFFNHSNFFEAHNEYLEILRGLGIIGVALFVIIVIKDVILKIKHPAILSSLMAICVCALLNPVWHVPQLQFLTVLLIGLGLNVALNKGDENVRTI